MDTTKFKLEDIFGDAISQYSTSPEQITESNNFLARLM